MCLAVDQETLTAVAGSADESLVKVALEVCLACMRDMLVNRRITRV
jgi:hypothetical protein